MVFTVALVAQGAMGAGTGAALSENGVRVVTSLEGRSAASARRAAEAKMEPVSDAEMAAADVILSIVPPGEALAFARRMAPHLTAAAKKPIFVDANAVSPATVRDIAAVIATTGAPFVDAGIIGGPPKGGYCPAYYASGADAPRLMVLARNGLDVRVLDAPIGAASALKMSYAGITKGLTGIGSAMMLAAARNGAAEGLRNELAESQKELTPWFERQIPGMYAKAYRWVAEMREIRDFLHGDPAGAMIYEGMAQLYERLAADEAGEKTEVNALDAFLALTPELRPQKPITYRQMMAAAEKEVVTLTVDQAREASARPDVTLVDLRDPRELEREGRIPGALHCPRGMLEFWIDRTSPYHKPVFSEHRRFVFFCSAGWRSVLATQTAQRMGLLAAHVGGGFKAWKEAGGPIEGSGA
jgi:3-hydroxyisobutyrate dehydrogenase-like beta-hydroxyacid dehydrogenase/rhodanese-related sulfurtransferase